MNTNSFIGHSVSIEEAKQFAPAAFATSAAPHIRSKNYNFTSSEEIIGHMQSLGFELTMARQSGTKSDLWKNYGAHMLGFQKSDLYISDGNGGVEARPTIILSNSHDGSRPVQFDMGMYRLVCSNGLVVKSMDLGRYRERHSRMDLAGVKTMLDEMIGRLPKTTETINRWVGRDMSAQERQAFAKEALALRVGSDREASEHEIRSLLEPRREADRATNLWTTFNVAQEALTRGGFMLGERQARAITNPWADKTLNESLWTLAEAWAG